MKEEIDTLKEDFQKAKKEVQAEIVKAYKLVCVYFICKAWTQWDKAITEMQMKDPWVTVNGVSHKGPHMKTWVSIWTASNSTSLLSFLVMPQSCSATICNKE